MRRHLPLTVAASPAGRGRRPRCVAAAVAPQEQIKTNQSDRTPRAGSNGFSPRESSPIQAKTAPDARKHSVPCWYTASDTRKYGCSPGSRWLRYATNYMAERDTVRRPRLFPNVFYFGFAYLSFIGRDFASLALALDATPYLSLFW